MCLDDYFCWIGVPPGCNHCHMWSGFLGVSDTAIAYASTLCIHPICIDRFWTCMICFSAWLSCLQRFGLAQTFSLLLLESVYVVFLYNRRALHWLVATLSGRASICSSTTFEYRLPCLLPTTGLIWNCQISSAAPVFANTSARSLVFHRCCHLRR